MLGKKNVNGKPHIESVSPGAALPGGEIRINGSGLRPVELKRPRVQFGEIDGAVVISSDAFVVARVPEGATSGPVVVATNGAVSNPQVVRVAVPIADNLHPVTNPAIDGDGNIFVTFSGSRGQQVPVSLFKIDTNYAVKPFLSNLMNATSIAFDREGQMYVSSRHDGTVYRVAPNGTMSSYAEGMGVATGIAFDREQNLYVGDRSGTIFKIAQRPPDLRICYPRTQRLRLSSRFQSCRRSLCNRTNHIQLRRGAPDRHAWHGHKLLSWSGTPAGPCFRQRWQSLRGRFPAGKRGIVKITPDGKASLEVAGQNLVGLCFAPGRSAVLATTGAVHHLSWNISGLPLLPD